MNRRLVQRNISFIQRLKQNLRFSVIGVAYPFRLAVNDPQKGSIPIHHDKGFVLMNRERTVKRQFIVARIYPGDCHEFGINAIGDRMPAISQSGHSVLRLTRRLGERCDHMMGIAIACTLVIRAGKNPQP